MNKYINNFMNNSSITNDDIENQKLINNNYICVICNDNKLEENSKACPINKCNIRCCSDCKEKLDEWIETKGTCPLCRGEVISKTRIITSVGMLIFGEYYIIDNDTRTNPVDLYLLCRECVLNKVCKFILLFSTLLFIMVVIFVELTQHNYHNYHNNQNNSLMNSTNITI